MHSGYRGTAVSTVCLQALPLSLSHRKFGYDISLHPHASPSEQTFRDGEGDISNAPSPIVFSLISVSFREAALSFALRTSCHASSQIGQNFYRKFEGLNSNVCLPTFKALCYCYILKLSCSFTVIQRTFLCLD